MHGWQGLEGPDFDFGIIFASDRRRRRDTGKIGAPYHYERLILAGRLSPSRCIQQSAQ
jgi:hypothetical protein